MSKISDDLKEIADSKKRRADYKEKSSFRLYQWHCIDIARRWLFEEIEAEEALHLLWEAGEETNDTTLTYWADRFFEAYNIEEE